MKRSKFSLSHYKLLTGDMGYLYPITWYEALPGDSIQQQTSMLIRLSPLVAPVMHPVMVRIHHWYVPLRLIWEDFEDFITGGSDGDDSSTPPYVAMGSNSEGTLWDYLGVPAETFGATLNISALPLRAYNLIYNEHYRDQDLVSEETISTASGADSTTNTSILKCAWAKDYFTTARPWEQKGTAVTIPLGDEAEVISDPSSNGKPQWKPEGGSEILAMQTLADGTSVNNFWDGTATGGGNKNMLWHNPKLVADLSSATGISVNDLRLALSIQRYQEARAQYGSRYVEYLRYLGVTPLDGRINNPEYLGGGRQTVQFSEVLQTAEGTDPVGSMKGHGIAAMRTNRYRRYFPEHGIVMSIASVVPKAIYSQNLYRGFSRTIKEDYWQRELQTIGEQEIPNHEVYAAHSSPTDVFGYQARYDEYRSLPSSIAGEFRSTLDSWHYSRIHTSDVALNQSFIEATPTKRTFASTNTDCLYMMANHSIQARRMLSRKAKTKTF